MRYAGQPVAPAWRQVYHATWLRYLERRVKVKEGERRSESARVEGKESVSSIERPALYLLQVLGMGQSRQHAK